MTPVKALLVSSAARGSATLVAVIRTKVVAVLLGPEGVGLLGLLTSIQEVIAQAAEGGLSHSAVRQIARARNTPARLARILRALALAVLTLATLAAAAVWVFRETLSKLILGTPNYAFTLGLLGLGVAMLMIFRWQQTVLSGFQKVGAHAWVTTGAGTLGAMAGIAAVMQWGEDGIILAVLLPPSFGVVIAPFFTRRLRISGYRASNLLLTVKHGQTLFRLGIYLMLSALAVFFTPMILRAFLAQDAGLYQVGLFQAGLVMTMHLTALITAAVSMDYYPRLSAATGSVSETRNLMNQQTRMHLAFGGPMATLVIVFAPSLLTVLFSDAFLAAESMLQWMMLGAVLRLVAVPAEMVLMSKARSGTILLLQLAHQGFVVSTALSMWPIIGLDGFGIAYCLGQILHLSLISALNWRDGKVFWQMNVTTPLLVLLALGLVAMVATALAPFIGWAIGGTSIIVGFLTLNRTTGNGFARLRQKLQNLRALGT